MKVNVISRDSCQPIGTMLEVAEDIVIGELTGQPMHTIIGGDFWNNGKNDNAKYIHARFFEKL